MELFCAHIQNPISKIGCIESNTYRFYENNTLTNNSKIQCKKECKTVDYNLSTSFAKYPTEVYKRIVNTLSGYYSAKYSDRQNFSYLDEKNILAVNLFYMVINSSEKYVAIFNLNFEFSIGYFLYYHSRKTSKTSNRPDI